MGIKVIELSKDWRLVRIQLPLTPRTRNPGGTMFGGAVAALADPIPALACDRIFPGNAVWTRELHVDFRQPGIADLELRFEFGNDIEQQVSEELHDQGRSTPCFEFGFYLPDGELSAWITNRVAIRPPGTRLTRTGALGKSADNILKSDEHD
jgi:hypothetical protein